MISRLLAGTITAAVALGVAGGASAAPGDRDPSFDPPPLSGPVHSVAALSDGKYLIGGVFTNADGDPDTDFVARLKSDGTLDDTFTPPDLNEAVYSVAELTDGNYLIGGFFTNAGYARVARLNSDGSRDTSFTPPALNNAVESVAELSDGKYLIGGVFTDAGYARVARLNSDGSRDTSFTPPTLNNMVYSVAALSDGKYLVGGSFTDTGYARVARLNSDGSRDTSFTPPPLSLPVHSVAALSDGKYLVGGNFTNPGYAGVVRLNSDGSRDTSFTPPALNGPVYSVAALPDGKYLIGGHFTDTGYARVARLNSNGSRDTSFTQPALNYAVYSVAALSDGKYLVGGNFTEYLARLEGGPAELPEVPEDVLPENPVIIDNTDKPIGLPNNRPVYFPIAGWDPNARGACKRSETNKKLAKCVSAMNKLPDFTGIYALKANLSGTKHKMKGACRWDGGDSECRVYLNRRGKWRLTWTAGEKTTARTVVVP